MNNLGFEPHKPVEAEKFFTDFVHNFGGEKISDRLSTSPSFENADFYFPESKVVAELKCLETDFPKLKSYQDKWIELQKKWISEKKFLCL